MGKHFWVVVGIIAAVFLATTVIPSPYDDWLVVALMLGSVGLGAHQTWQAQRLASETRLVAKLRRTGHQRASLCFALIFAVMFVLMVRMDPQMSDFTRSTMPWILIAMIGLQLMTGLPRGRITEAGILIHDGLLRWEAMKDPDWGRDQPTTLHFAFEREGKLVNGKCTFHQADVEPVTAALIRYAAYSPVTGS